jgi:hypothetical protein
MAVVMVVFSGRWVHLRFQLVALASLMLLGLASALIRRVVGKISRQIDDAAEIFDDHLWREHEHV